ncbi:hypothetical protein LTR28_006747, partial [Elasticomyces elasticus]
FDVSSTEIGRLREDILRLYVSDLPTDTTELEVREFMQQFADVNQVEIRTIYDERKHMHVFAFVQFPTTAEARRGLEVNGVILRGRAVRVQISREYWDRSRRTFRDPLKLRQDYFAGNTSDKSFNHSGAPEDSHQTHYQLMETQDAKAASQPAPNISESQILESQSKRGKVGNDMTSKDGFGRDTPQPRLDGVTLAQTLQKRDRSRSDACAVAAAVPTPSESPVGVHEEDAAAVVARTNPAVLVSETEPGYSTENNIGTGSRAKPDLNGDGFVFSDSSHIDQPSTARVSGEAVEPDTIALAATDNAATESASTSHAETQHATTKPAGTEFIITEPATTKPAMGGYARVEPIAEKLPMETSGEAKNPDKNARSAHPAGEEISASSPLPHGEEDSSFYSAKETPEPKRIVSAALSTASSSTSETIKDKGISTPGSPSVSQARGIGKKVKPPGPKQTEALSPFAFKPARQKKEKKPKSTKGQTKGMPVETSREESQPQDTTDPARMPPKKTLERADMSETTPAQHQNPVLDVKSASAKVECPPSTEASSTAPADVAKTAPTFLERMASNLRSKVLGQNEAKAEPLPETATNIPASIADVNFASSDAVASSEAADEALAEQTEQVTAKKMNKKNKSKKKNSSTKGGVDDSSSVSGSVASTTPGEKSSRIGVDGKAFSPNLAPRHQRPRSITPGRNDVLVASKPLNAGKKKPRRHGSGKSRDSFEDAEEDSGERESSRYDCTLEEALHLVIALIQPFDFLIHSKMLLGSLLGLESARYFDIFWDTMLLLTDRFSDEEKTRSVNLKILKQLRAIASNNPKVAFLTGHGPDIEHITLLQSAPDSKKMLQPEDLGTSTTGEADEELSPAVVASRLKLRQDEQKTEEKRRRKQSVDAAFQRMIESVPSLSTLSNSGDPTATLEGLGITIIDDKVCE